MKSNSLMAVLVGFALTSPVVYGATTGFEASEGWVIGQPPPAGSGCTLELGRGDAPGVCAVSGGQALALPCGARGIFDISSLPMTGVQHVTVDLSFTSVNYLLDPYRTMKMLTFGSLQVINSLTAGSGISILFDAAKANTAPTSYMNNEDLIMKVNFLGSYVAWIPFASPATYRFDFAIDYTKNTTTFTLFRDGGTTPVATTTWSGTFDANLATVLSGSWYAPEGTTTYVDNLFIGTVPEPVPYTYTTNNGAITITGYTGLGGAVTIPSLIEGLSVTSIGTNAFESKSSLLSVAIPNTVTNIGDRAFSSCAKLASVTIGTNVTSIGLLAFVSCNMTSITIPDSVTSVGSSAFQYCYSLTNAMIGRGVTSVLDTAFYRCTNLTAIAVDTANPSFSSVEGVLFDKSQTTIIFYPPAKSGSDYTIPAGVTSVGSTAFQFSSSLTAITADINSPAFSSVDGVLFNKDLTTLFQCPRGKAGIYTVPDSVTNIGNNAFYSCAELTNIIIPNSVNKLGDWLFRECLNLTSVTLPEGIPSMGFGAFYGCSKLTGITIPDGVSKIENWGFFGCSSLANVTIPRSVTNLADNAFRNGTRLGGLYFEGNAPSLGSSVFPTNTIIYYLPDATGWSAPFGGRPTVLWNPQIQTGDTSFGIQSNWFGFNIAGTNNYSVMVEACTNLTSGSWEPLQTGALANGLFSFSDPQSTNYPGRFYRLRMP